MRVKLDENLGTRGEELFSRCGHDVATVAGEHLQSAEDAVLIDYCKEEKRCLVTLDLDFANPLRFRPKLYAGIVVLRMPHRGTPADLQELTEKAASLLGSRDIAGKLWIVQKTSVREYRPDDEEW